MSTQDIAIAIWDIKNIFVENIFTPFARYTLGITVLRLANSLDSSQTPTTKYRELFRSTCNTQN